MDEQSDWLAAIQATCNNEFAPCWLKKRPRRLRDAPFPERLELTVNGCGLAGVYRRQDGHTATYHCDKIPNVRIELSTALGLWLLTSGANEQAEKTRWFYGLGEAPGRELLYVGNAAQDLMHMDWFPVLGAMPAPRSLCESSPKTDLTLDTLHLGGLSAETTSTILAFLLDLRSTRLRSSNLGRAVCDWACDTAPQIALWLMGHAGDALHMARVCRCWQQLVRLYKALWPQDFLRLFQLHGSHGWPVAQPREVLQVLSRSSWQNMLHLTDLEAFRDHAWPVHVTSVALRMPVRASTDHYLDFSLLRQLRGPFSHFAWRLLHDVPLPWAKRLATRPAAREGMTSSRASAESESESKTLTADLLYENGMQGAQHLAAGSELLMTPGGFVTRGGHFVRRRVGGALRELQRHMPQLCLTGWSQGWSSSFRDGKQLCFFCERDVEKERCRQCKDTRSWSTLSATFSMSFNVEMSELTQVEFAIEARALPFISISSDVRSYDELEEFFGKPEDEESDASESPNVGDQAQAEPELAPACEAHHAP